MAIPQEAYPVPAIKKPARLVSLDMLRGLTVAWMIVVNTSGDSRYTFHELAHSKWNGCTIADVIFPCFLFMMGISAQISIRSKLRKQTPKKDVLLQSLKRSALLFLFGLVVNSFPLFHLDTLRFCGVLQRIALCYFLCVVLLMYFKPRVLVACTAILLIGYWIALRWIPIPHIGYPGLDVPLMDHFANLSSWLDRALIPQAHLYRQGVYDPEGILATLPSLASTLIGALAGLWLQKQQSRGRTATGLLLASISCMTIGLVWAHWFPLNKRLWSSSFALFTSGTSLLLLWCFYALLDRKERQAPKWLLPLVVFGTNALPAYIFSELLASALSTWHLSSGLSLQKWLYQPFLHISATLSIAALSYAVAFMFVCFLATYLLYRKHIFLKV